MDSEQSRQARVAAIVTQWVSAGRPGGRPALLAAHPELQPDLAEHLDRLDAILIARRVATEAGGDEQAFDLSSLRAGLPDYELGPEIHRGGQGIVYQARHIHTGRTVAIKVLARGAQASDRERFRLEREAELVARLQHPSIVALYESGVAGGHLYCVMQFVDGVVIDDYVLWKDLDVRAIARLMIPVCDAVDFAHRNGVLHRDLHSGNIVVDEQGTPHVVDFGLAKSISDEPERRITMEGAIAGVPAYLSPEHFGYGDARVDVQSDVYALGVILFELLTEQFPYAFDERDAHSIRAAVLGQEPRSLRTALRTSDSERGVDPRLVDADLEAIVAAALRREKAERYQSAEALGADLRRWLAGEAVQARAHLFWYRLRKTLKRNRVAVAAAVIVALSLGWTAWTWRTGLARTRTALYLALEQVQKALTILEEGIRPLPGASAIRDDILREAARTLRQLQAELADDEEFSEVAAALEESLADFEVARGEFRSARSTYRTLLAKAVPSNRTRLARKLAEAGGTVDAALERGILATFSDADADRSQTLEALRYVLHSARRHSDRREFREMLRITERCEGTLARDWTTVPEAVDFLRLQGAMAGVRGVALFELGDSRAEAELRRSRTLRSDLLNSRPYDVDARLELAIVVARLGTLERNRGSLEKASSLYGDAAAIIQPLTALEPHRWAFLRTELAIFSSHARVLMDLGREPEAAKLIARVATMGNSLQLEARQDPESLQLIAYAYTMEGHLHHSLGAYEVSVAAYESAAAIQQDLVDLEPMSVPRRNHLAETLLYIAWPAVALEEHELAAEVCRGAVTNLLALGQRSFDDSEARMNLVSALICLADIAARLGDRNVICEAEQALDFAEELLCDPRLPRVANQGYWQDCVTALETNRALLDGIKPQAAANPGAESEPD